ncbi:MAG: N-acetylmuramoyl-L-alanine amidase [Defluviitaleaceae bacterium]|nr:N-acetylmuramoyl-L-alanine amidase [Defluviitaleaceae bacterium]
MKNFKWMALAMIMLASLSVHQKIIVIDAGHGGWDPGKVSSENHEEKHINLAITEALQMHLEQAGAVVFLTRAEDAALGDTKRTDLRARTNMPSDMHADLFISIHQNAFPKSTVRGAQAFFYEGSAEGEKLAKAIQAHIKGYLDTENRMEAKGSTSYFILKETTAPAVLVECGFLTNHDEAARLADEIYQQKVAWAIYLGILDYFSN